jgi:NAD(P)-dependent dehydrogenase (short-subunit alcohol dehydrogenase family)
MIPKWSAYDSLSELGEQPAQLEEELISTFRTNCVGNIHLFNLFMPLILAGTVKKVITLSTGMADADLITKYSLTVGAPYSISKAAMNFAVASYSAQYAKDGVLFMGISPGFVQTGQYDGGKCNLISGKVRIMLNEDSDTRTVRKAGRYGCEVHEVCAAFHWAGGYQGCCKSCFSGRRKG